MTKSRRKRPSQLVRTIPMEELGENFIGNLTTGLKSQFENSIEFAKGRFIQLHHSNESGSLAANKTICHYQLDRGEAIELFVVFDGYLNQLLFHYQLRILGIPADKVDTFSKVEEGIKTFLNKLDVPGQLDSQYTKLKHFRTLRNQFAHYNHGTFYFQAKHESFETFIKKLDGIELGHDEWCFIDGKAGVKIPYNFTSGNFNGELSKTMISFYKDLVDFLFN